MNKELQQFGKSKQIPANVLKWIWNNKETLLALIALLFPAKQQAFADPVETCGGVNKPTYKPTPNGSWQCIAGEWKWIEDLG